MVRGGGFCVDCRWLCLLVWQEGNAEGPEITRRLTARGRDGDVIDRVVADSGKEPETSLSVSTYMRKYLRVMGYQPVEAGCAPLKNPSPAASERAE